MKTRAVFFWAAVLASIPASAWAQPEPPPWQAEAHETPVSREKPWFAGAEGFSGKLSVGPAYRRLFDVSIVGADLGVAIGSQTHSGGWYGTLGLLLGSTSFGLFTRQATVGASWEAPIGRLHLGLAPELSYVAIARASTDGKMEDLGGGVWGFVSYDLEVGDNHALFVAGKAGADIYSSNNSGNPIFWGGSASLGVRLF